ncbi:Hypothetical_protein [Hexamita inflata]|uniref:Hypothetical_protein n=1 Tax=Hexamita inflata TaxID=28002 RepID=A0ABP1I327_9EUKA
MILSEVPITDWFEDDDAEEEIQKLLTKFLTTINKASKTLYDQTMIGATAKAILQKETHRLLFEFLYTHSQFEIEIDPALINKKTLFLTVNNCSLSDTHGEVDFKPFKPLLARRFKMLCDDEQYDLAFKIPSNLNENTYHVDVSAEVMHGTIIAHSPYCLRLSMLEASASRNNKQIKAIVKPYVSVFKHYSQVQNYSSILLFQQEKSIIKTNTQLVKDFDCFDLQNIQIVPSFPSKEETMFIQKNLNEFSNKHVGNKDDEVTLDEIPVADSFTIFMLKMQKKIDSIKVKKGIVTQEEKVTDEKVKTAVTNEKTEKPEEEGKRTKIKVKMTPEQLQAAKEEKEARKLKQQQEMQKQQEEEKLKKAQERAAEKAAEKAAAEKQKAEEAVKQQKIKEVEKKKEAAKIEDKKQEVKVTEQKPQPKEHKQDKNVIEQKPKEVQKPVQPVAPTKQVYQNTHIAPAAVIVPEAEKKSLLPVFVNLKFTAESFTQYQPSLQSQKAKEIQNLCQQIDQQFTLLALYINQMKFKKPNIQNSYMLAFLVEVQHLDEKLLNELKNNLKLLIVNLNFKTKSIYLNSILRQIQVTVQKLVKNHQKSYNLNNCLQIHGMQIEDERVNMELWNGREDYCLEFCIQLLGEELGETVRSILDQL